jgi:hypothetical protein
VNKGAGEGGFGHDCNGLPLARLIMSAALFQLLLYAAAQFAANRFSITLHGNLRVGTALQVVTHETPIEDRRPLETSFP